MPEEEFLQPLLSDDSHDGASTGPQDGADSSRGDQNTKHVLHSQDSFSMKDDVLGALDLFASVAC